MSTGFQLSKNPLHSSVLAHQWEERLDTIAPFIAFRLRLASEHLAQLQTENFSLHEQVAQLNHRVVMLESLLQNARQRELDLRAELIGQN